MPADGSTRYEAEYVLREDGVYAIVYSFRRTLAYRYYSKAVQCDPVTGEQPLKLGANEAAMTPPS